MSALGWIFGNAKRIAIFVIGAALVVLGIILIPLPGPGMLVVLFGLGVLAREFAWAQRTLEKAKEHATRGHDAVRSRLRQRRGGVAR